ncbi:putative transcription factor GRAS family [Helianthus annuus]|nr:putative transcription factor GRAS family [Helianthus annuus]
MFFPSVYETVSVIKYKPLKVMKSNEMPPLDTHIFRKIHNYSIGNVENREIDSHGKLPLLYEDGSGNKYNKATDGFSFSTGNHQVEFEPLKSFHSLDALFLDTTPPFHSYEHKMRELADIESQYSELIKPHTQSHEKAVQHDPSGPKLSTDAIIRLGGERFIQSCSSTSMKDISISNHPYGGSFSGLSDEEVKDVQLIENLLLSSEKVTKQQYERSIKLLDWCDVLSCSMENPIQRLVHYFSKALREKIDKENGRDTSSGSKKKDEANLAERVMTPSATATMLYEKTPLYQAGHFAGVQALVDGLSGLKNVHVIDLSIKQGTQCTILMQALVSQPNCPIEHLKITAVGTNSKQKIEQTGVWLKSFAESINLSFSFNLVIVEDMLDFKKGLLELDPDEALGVYTSCGLWGMIAQQDRLESLMKVIRSIKPLVMVVCEVAANLNSLNFVNRFIEGLFFFGALFDFLEECLGCEDEIRTFTESMHFGKGISNIVASEGAERVMRHVNINVWRKFFARFGMKETELSMSSLYQAKLVVEKFPCGSGCTFDRDGDSLVIGWKGTPIQSLSSWKFS